MATVPGSKSMPHGATEAPQSPSPGSIPSGAVAIAHRGAGCLIELLLGRRLPLDPPFYVGCGFQVPTYTSHKGIDFYGTPGDVPVKRSCPFQGIGVSGANVYPAFPGCSHQATLAKVVYAQNAYGTIGNCVILEHTDNTHEIWIRTIYMHLATIAVSVGQFVPTTTAIGTMGYTGGYLSTNAHLHFEVNDHRPANPHWRVEDELNLMPDSVTRWRPAKDPEIYLPDVAGGELLRVAAVPPPAQVPSGPPPAYQGLLDPIWLTYRHPYAGEDHVRRVDTFDLDGNPRWYLGAYMDTQTDYEVYPICDGPGGKIYVARVYQQTVGPYTFIDVTLIHLDTQYRWMVVSEYENLESVDVAEGDWITVNTRIGVAGQRDIGTPGPPYGSTTIHLWRKQAASAEEWVEDEPFTWPNIAGVGGQSANWEFWADPACCLPEPATFEATGGSPTWAYLRDCVSEPGWA